MKKYLLITILIISLASIFYIGNNLRNHSKITEIEQKDKLNFDAVENNNLPDEKQNENKIIGVSEFIEIDKIHKGSGMAIFEKLNDNSIIKFEDFAVTDGPDLYVYLSKNQNIKTTRELGEYVSLGKLKNNNGTQIYNAPKDIENYKSVVIWCRAFNVLFSVAELK